MYEVYIYIRMNLFINKDELVSNDSLFQEIHLVAISYWYLNHKGVQIIDNMYEAFIDYDILGNFNGKQ